MNFAFLRPLFLAGALVFGAAGPATSQADPAAWDATWVGDWNDGDGSQVVIAGGAVIGFFWAGEYLTIENSTNLSDGEPIKFIWPGGEAVVHSSTVDGELVLLITETGKPETGFTLKHQ